MSRLWFVSCLLEVRKDVIDAFESDVQVFCCTAGVEEVVAGDVFDEGAGVCDVVVEIGSFIETSFGSTFDKDTTGLPAGVRLVIMVSSVEN